MTCDELSVDGVVLLSGGVDSSTVLALLRKEGRSASGLFVDYGQLAAAEERRASQRIAENYSVAWAEVFVEGLSTPRFREVRGRNDLLLAIAVVHSAAPVVAIGTHAGTPYVDCSPCHQDAWQKLFDVQYQGDRRLVAPLQHLTKPQVLALAAELGVPMHETYSCEDAGGPCGRCASCVDRGFRYARP